MARMSNCLRYLRARRLLLALGLAGLAGLAQGADRSHQREQFRRLSEKTLTTVRAVFGFVALILPVYGFFHAP